MTSAPLPVLEAHAAFAAACETWFASLPKEVARPNAPPRAPEPPNAQGIACEVALQPVEVVDQLTSEFSIMLMLGLVLGAGAGFLFRPVAETLGGLIARLVWRPLRRRLQRGVTMPRR